MDGDREMENALSFFEWITGWTVIIGLCLLFWVGVYSVQ
jgi:hypothetical protein